jgi:hypothetical protein
MVVVYPVNFSSIVYHATADRDRAVSAREAGVWRWRDDST